MSAVQTEILDKISSMTVLELSELIKAMEDKFGVSAAAAVAVPARRRRAPPPPPKSRPNSRSCSLVRREQGERDQGGARADRPRPEEAKDLVDGAPKPSRKATPRPMPKREEEAEEAGAKVEVK